MILLFLYFLISNFEDSMLIENPCGTMVPRYGDQDWGVGCFGVPDNFYATVYSDTLGTIYGFIKPYYSFFQLYDREGKAVQLTGNDTECVGNCIPMFIKIQDHKSPNFIKCFWKSFNQGLYLSKSELANYKTKYYSYKELIYIDQNPVNHIPTSQLGINLPMSCLNLREGPSNKYPIITCVAGNDHNTEGEVRVKVLDHEDSWAKVEVTTWIMDQTIKDEEVEDGPCPSILKSKRIGWFKVVDDSGFPNLWFASGGY